MLTLDDWEKAEGQPCCQCGQKDLKIVEGLCRKCYQAEQKRVAKKMELKSREKNLSSIFKERRKCKKR